MEGKLYLFSWSGLLISTLEWLLLTTDREFVGMSCIRMMVENSIVLARRSVGYLFWKGVRFHFLCLWFFVWEGHFVMRSWRCFWWRLKLHIRYVLIKSRNLYWRFLFFAFRFLFLTPFLLYISFSHLSMHTSCLCWWGLLSISTCLVWAFQAYMYTHCVGRRLKIARSRLTG